jgi:hypothetical protein
MFKTGRQQTAMDDGTTPAAPTADTEKQAVETEIEAMQSQLDAMKKRLAELGADKV